MRILVVGNGGREHALAWKLAQSTKCSELFCAPGNPGTAALAKNVDIAADDIETLVRFAQDNNIELVVVGPEIPLCAGLVDACEAQGIKAWGPSKAAASLEDSKVVMKEFLRAHNIPTASFKVFSDANDAYEYIDECGAPIVVKCDGLAAGKGVTVAATVEEAKNAVRSIMVDKVFGAAAGRQIVIEEILRGEEISVFAFCDGQNALLLDYAQDHKQAYDGDRGPNTGGMGAFTPATGLLSDKDEDAVVERILVPTLSGLKKEGRPYKGILYMGLMVTEYGPKVVEYNVRFGDPECQPLMLRLESDLVDIMLGCIDGTLDKQELQWSDQSAVCITLASEGYPGSYPKGVEINGLDNLPEGATVFHAGTAEKNGVTVTAGGRVLSVCALGDDFEAARQKAYEAVDAVEFKGMHFRKDIGRRTEARAAQ